MQPINYDFNERLNMSNGYSSKKDVASIILENIPSSTNVIKAHSENDRNGTDWWVETLSGNFLSVDAKIRSKDFSLHGQDDLALEIWSVVEKKVVGWTRDKKKRTDYILWMWTDTGRWCILPFQMLCFVFENKLSEWIKNYKIAMQFTPNHCGYHSECVFVPRHEVWRQIYFAFGGCKNMQV